LAAAIRRQIPSSSGTNYMASAAVFEMGALVVGSWLLLWPQTRFRHSFIIAAVFLTALGILLSNIFPN